MQFFYKLSITVLITAFASTVQAQTKFFTDAGQNRQVTTTGQRTIIPQKFRTSSVDVTALKNFLWTLPGEKSVRFNRNMAPVLEVPMPNGSMARFRVWESSVQAPELAAKFPEIRTFAGQGIDDPAATMRFDYNPYFGFSAQILSPNGRIFIDPYARWDINTVMSYYTGDAKRESGFECLTDAPMPDNYIPEAGPCRGTQLVTYRLAITCTGEYAQTVGGGLAGPTHAAIVLGVNRVTQVYEDELSVRLELIANNDLVEFLNPATDPFLNNGGSDLNLITGVINSAVGSANYDVGHLFCTASNAGVAGLGVVCGGNKGRGLTGGLNPVGDAYYIDYVAHELGHQFNAPHSFNSNTCASTGGSYEPGSGTTIMAYAGICSATENIQPNSDAVFHAISYDFITNFISTGGGAGCGVVTATGNTLPVISTLDNNNISIPVNTPFTLRGSASDADGDAITYNWEGWDVGSAGSWPSAATSTTRPLFRTRVSKSDGSRTFPDIRVIAANYPGTSAPSAMDGLRGEVLPQVARTMKFRLTVRDNRAGGGGVVSSGEGCQTSTTFQVNAVGTTPFTVSSPNGGETYNGGTVQTITWNNAGTDAAPFNVANVRITMSTDGGLTYPHELTASTPNDGSQALALPAVVTTQARIRIEALGNVFFDISNTNFVVNAAPNGFSFSSPGPVVSACPAASSLSTTLSATYNGTFSTPITLTATTVPAGTTVSFGTNPLQTGSLSTLVTLNGTAALNAGTYTVTVTGTAGAIVVTRDITFTITAGAGPVITSSPVAASVCPGDNASFGVVATGSYQWQVSTPAVPAFTNIPGANSATYTVTGATAAQNGNQYRVIVSNQCGSTTSAAAGLTVNVPPAITTQPVSITLCASSNHTFTSAATGSNLTYQWQVSTAAVPAFTNIPGETNATLSLTNITSAMNGNQYRVIVSGTCSPAATSNAATLTVVTSVTVTTNPSDIVVCDGSNATFTVAGAGAGIIYQWQVNTGAGFVNVPNTPPYSGANSATLTITGATPAMSGYLYRAQLSNATCTTPGVSSSATLTVNTLPDITTQPASSTICLGSNTSFTVAATGTGITYQWEVNTGSGFAAVSNTGVYSGATTNTLQVTGAIAAMNGYIYRAVVSGTCPPAETSNAVTLTVISPVAITTQPPVTREICSGSTTSLTVAGSSVQTISYQWQVNTGAGFTNISNGGVYSGANSATLEINAAGTNLNGAIYRVLLSNTTCTAPTVSASSTLTVRQLPAVTLTASATSLLPGQVSVLTATPSAATTGTLSTTWLFNGQPINPASNTFNANVESIGTYQVNIQETFASGLVCSNQSSQVVIDAPASTRLFVFPTPNDGNFTISYFNNGGNTTKRTIIIYDSKGGQVYNREFPVTGPYTLIPINLQRANTGIYFILIGDATGKKLAEGKVHIR